MDPLEGRRILIVEDEVLIALDLENILKQTGAEVIGPMATVSDALACLSDHAPVDGAVLDVNLGGEFVFPVADALMESRVPFLFLTGHSDDHLPARHHDRPVIRKPYLASHLLEALRTTIDAADRI
jgi:two-component SAPR family response regulator